MPKTPRISRSVQVAYRSTVKGTSVDAQVTNKDLPKLVMFRDSFANHLIAYMSENFSRSVYISPPRIDYTILEQEKPDIVIFEIVERHLDALLHMY